MKLLKSFKKLAPAGGFPSPIGILNTTSSLKQLLESSQNSIYDNLPEYIQQNFETKAFSIFNTGKAALFHLFSAIKKSTNAEYVLISSYTCPDIPLAALNAGLKVYAVETNQLTLEIEYEAIPSSVKENLAAIVLSNLYGLVDDIKPARRLRDETGCLIIDDACQSFYGTRDSEQVGFREGTVGVFSFGRGKALCGIGGGALSFSDSQSEVLKNLFVVELFPGLIKNVSDYLKVWGYWFFEKPTPYFVLSFVPFLGLGKTLPKSDSSKMLPSRVALLTAAKQTVNFETTLSKREQNFRELEQGLINVEAFSSVHLNREFVPADRIFPLRYALIFQDPKLRERAYQGLKSLGASISYPKMLTAYPEFEDSVESASSINSESIALRVMTLPLHRYVTADDLFEMTKFLKNLSC